MSVYKLSGCGFESRCCHLTSDIASVLSKEFLDIEAAIETRFTLKRVRDMTRTYSHLTFWTNIFKSTGEVEHPEVATTKKNP